MQKIALLAFAAPRLSLIFSPRDLPPFTLA
jgi:hypothetical protein